jgi:hypothetical protein
LVSVERQIVRGEWCLVSSVHWQNMNESDSWTSICIASNSKGARIIVWVAIKN